MVWSIAQSSNMQNKQSQMFRNFLLFSYLLGGISLLNFEIEQNKQKIFNTQQQIWYQGPFYDGKTSCTIGNQIFSLKCGFGIDSDIGQKYRSIWISVSVADLNQNRGFNRTLETNAGCQIIRFSPRILKLVSYLSKKYHAHCQNMFQSKFCNIERTPLILKFQ